MEDYLDIINKIDELVDDAKTIGSLFNVLIKAYFSFDETSVSSESYKLSGEAAIVCNAYPDLTKLLRVAYDKNEELQKEMCDLSSQIYNNKSLTEARKKQIPSKINNQFNSIDKR